MSEPPTKDSSAAGVDPNQELEPSVPPANIANNNDEWENPTHLIYTCSICGKAFSEPYFLRRHQSVHTKYRPYLCEECPRTFTQKVSLDRHKLIHLREKKFQCPHCPMKFRQKPNLNTHVKQVHPPSDDADELANRFVCKKCPSAFKRENRLQIHRARVHGEMVMFDEIVKRTSNAANDTSEESEDGDISDSDGSRRATQNTEEASEIVQKIVPSRRSEHMKGKTPQRQHECEVCKAAFLNKSHLAQHMVSHLGFKAYRCEICDKTFTTQQSLNTHARRHKLTEFPFSCDQCGLSLSRKSTLRRHQTMKHQEQKYSFRCPYCDKSFRWLHNCSMHIQRTHEKDGESSEEALLEPIKVALENKESARNDEEK